MTSTKLLFLFLEIPANVMIFSGAAVLEVHVIRHTETQTGRKTRFIYTRWLGWELWLSKALALTSQDQGSKNTYIEHLWDMWLFT